MNAATGLGGALPLQSWFGPPTSFVPLRNYTMTLTGVGSCAPPDLTIAKSHEGDFRRNRGGVWTIEVRNAGSLPTTGQVRVEDVLPLGIVVLGVRARLELHQPLGEGDLHAERCPGARRLVSVDPA